MTVGSSGCGKTILLLNMMYKRESGLKFKYLYVFSKSLEQRAYSELRKQYENVESEQGEKIAHFYATCEKLIPVNDRGDNSLVVFDVCLMEEQMKIKDYYIRGRYKNTACVYLRQSYSRVDIQEIRTNLNVLCVIKQNKHYTKRIYEDFVGSDIVNRLRRYT